MAKFLNTSGLTYYLEEMIKQSSDRLILISPFLRFNDRIKELLEDKNRLKIDIRLVYGKNDLYPDEASWLQTLQFVRLSFCKNLHAKCYLNEHQCIITSLNLYEFSQVNNNEMGVLINKNDDAQLYADALEEAQRLIRISDDVHLLPDSAPPPPVNSPKLPPIARTFDKLTTAKLAEKLGMSTTDLTAMLLQMGYIHMRGKAVLLTDKGKQAGGELKKGQYGYFCVWSVDMELVGEQHSSFADKLLKLLRF